MRYDIEVDENYMPVLRNGDFVISQSDTQHVEDITMSHPGEYKDHPMLGFAAILQVKKNINKESFKRDLKIQLEYDGYNPDIDLSGGFENLKIDI
jgi:hypothetical protein